MTFQVHHSNDLDRLADRLAGRLAEPVGSALAPEVIVVPATSTGRWLSYALADRLGISALTRVLLPGACVWWLMGRVLADLPAESPLEAGPMAWRIASLLADAAGEPVSTAGFEPVARYLAHAGRGGHIDLAREIAHVFERYATHRPQWLELWLAGRTNGLGADETWQSVLFRGVAADLPPVHPQETFFERLASSPEAVRALPARLSLFALVDLPAPYLAFFTRLARHVPVTLYLPNPCREYWGHVVRERSRLQAEIEQPALAPYLETGNRLFASLSQHGRALFEALAGVDDADDAFVAPAGGTVLATLQRDILDLADVAAPESRRTVAAGDTSVRIDVCHGPMREAEVLHDRLLALFAGDPSLRCEDILVLVPDLERHGGAIEAVFGAAREGRRIPVSVGDRGTLEEAPAARAVTRVLDVAQGRLVAEDVLALLEIPALARRFGIGADMLPVLHDWVDRLGIRWGEDARSLERLDLPPSRLGTWEAGIERLMFGLALGGGDGTHDPRAPFGDVVPFPDVEGAAALQAGRLVAFIERLCAVARSSGTDRTPADWAGWLAAIVDDFFEPAPDETASTAAVRRGITQAAIDATRGGYGGMLPLRPMLSVVRTHWSATPFGASFRSGGVTVADLAAARVVPARVMCLIGMDDHAFPRRDVPREFDLMQGRRRPGDPHRRDADRYAFLLALMNAREHLLISYGGRDIRTDKERPPSVVVTELVEAIRRTMVADGGGDPLAAALTHHPLQPFSARYGVDRGPVTFAAEWHPAVLAAEASFVRDDLSLPVIPPATLTLDDLVRFWRSPARWMLERCAHVAPHAPHAAIAVHEPLTLDGLAQFTIRDDIVRASLDTGVGRPAIFDPATLERLRADALLPDGRMGELWIEGVSSEVDLLVDKVLGYASGPSSELEVSIPVGGVMVVGALMVPATGDRCEWRSGRTRGVDRIAAWVRHVVWCAATPTAGATIVLGWEREAGKPKVTAESIVAIPQVEARMALAALVEGWMAGQGAPLPFYPESAWAYVEHHMIRQRPAAAALEHARKAWEGDDFGRSRAECTDPWFALAARGRGLDKAFEHCAVEVFGPYVEHRSR